MKLYKSLVKSLPKKTVVFSYGRFNPYTIGHELLVNRVKDIAKSVSADHIIALSKSKDSKNNPLSIDKKLYWANKL